MLFHISFMKKISLLGLIFLTTLQTEACICGMESIQTVRQRSIDQSDLIFIAKVVLTDTAKGYFTLKVLQIYKGPVGDEVEVSNVVDSIGTTLSCGFWPSPYWGDEFIVYANRVKGTERIYIDDCSATRSISNPNVHPSYETTGRGDRKQRRKARTDLKEEIKILEKLAGTLNTKASLRVDTDGFNVLSSITNWTRLTN